MQCQCLTGLLAGDGLALNRLALARNGCGLEVYLPIAPKNLHAQLLKCLGLAGC